MWTSWLRDSEGPQVASKMRVDIECVGGFLRLTGLDKGTGHFLVGFLFVADLLRSNSLDASLQFPVLGLFGDRAALSVQDGLAVLHALVALS